MIISIILFVAALVLFLVILRPWHLDSGKWIFTGLAVLATVFSLLLYYHWGASRQLKQAENLNAEIQLTKEKLLTLGSRENLLSELEKRVADHPDQAKGWYLLARLYSGSGDQKKALQAIGKAIILEPKNPLYNLALVDLHFSFYQKLNSADRSLLNSVLQSEPGNISALHLFALDAMQHKHTRLAIQYWERVLILIPADSEDAEVVRKLIKNAENLSKSQK